MKKTVVEDCLVLDVNKLNKERLFDKGLAWYGTSDWTNGGGISIASTGRKVSFADLQVKLDYRWREEDINYHVSIVSTPCHFGGGRYWFICPGRLPNGSACERRVGKLYKPYNARYFLCRHCYDLSYRSRQKWKRHTDVDLLIESISLESKLLRLNPGEKPPARLDRKTAKLIDIARERGII